MLTKIVWNNLVNGVKLDKKTYKIEDSLGFIGKEAQEAMGVVDNFYGGAVENVAKTSDENVYLLVGKHNIILDLLVLDITKLTNPELKCIARNKKLKYETNMNKTQILSLFGIDTEIKEEGDEEDA